MMKVHAGNSKINGSALIYFFKLFCALFCIWILLSGKFEVKFLAVGLLASLGTAYLFLPLFTMQNKKTGEPIYLLQTSLCRLLGYSLWLLGEVVKASLSATGLVLRGKTDYVPRVVYFRMDFENPLATAMLANSITLTPGTITLSISEDGIFGVHAITEACAADVLSGKMQRRVAKLYGETCEFEAMPECTLIAVSERTADSASAFSALKSHLRKGDPVHVHG